MSKDGTLHLVYQRQYYDDEDMDFFFINYTIFRNVPLSQLNRLNNKEFKQKYSFIFNKLHEKGIKVQLHYLPIHLHPYYRNLGFTENEFPNAEDYAKRAISLPLYPELKKNDINEKMVKLSMPTKRPERKSLRKISTSLPKNRPNKLIQNEINKKKRKVAATGVLQNLTEMTSAIDANEKKEEKKKKLNDKLLNNLQKMSALSKIGKVKKSDDQKISEKISISTIQAIQAHISKYYSPPPATRLRDNERVKLKIYLDREANVTKVEILETIRYNSDRAYRAVARSSRSAVLEASPLPYLPKNKYEKWKEIILNYSPR